MVEMGEIEACGGRGVEKGIALETHKGIDFSCALDNGGEGRAVYALAQSSNWNKCRHFLSEGSVVFKPCYELEQVRSPITRNR